MGPVLLAYVGVALMVGLSGIGSAFGLTICGNAVVGAMKKAPEKMGTYIALSALPSSQGLYGFVAYMMVQKFLVADMPWVTAAGIFGAGLIMGFAGFYSSVRQAHRRHRRRPQRLCRHDGYGRIPRALRHPRPRCVHPDIVHLPRCGSLTALQKESSAPSSPPKSEGAFLCNQRKK